MAELTELVESQREQLRRYEARLRDLVRAYKSLQKEKEALEASVKALSVVHEEDHEDEAKDKSCEESVAPVVVVEEAGIVSGKSILC